MLVRTLAGRLESQRLLLHTPAQQLALRNEQFLLRLCGLSF